MVEHRCAEQVGEGERSDTKVKEKKQHLDAFSVDA